VYAGPAPLSSPGAQRRHLVGGRAKRDPERIIVIEEGQAMSIPRLQWLKVTFCIKPSTNHLY